LVFGVIAAETASISSGDFGISGSGSLEYDPGARRRAPSTSASRVFAVGGEDFAAGLQFQSAGHHVEADETFCVKIIASVMPTNLARRIRVSHSSGGVWRRMKSIGSAAAGRATLSRARRLVWGWGEEPVLRFVTLGRASWPPEPLSNLADSL